MSYTTTKTETWSRTHARRVAGKVAADLRQMRQAYGEPSEADIEAFLGELTEYLAERYLERVTYGFVRNGEWIVALRYTADQYGNLTRDDRSGSIPRGVDVRGARWHSSLTQSAKLLALPDSAQQAFEAKLPVRRVPATEPSTGLRAWRTDRVYSSGGGGVSRGALGGGA